MIAYVGLALFALISRIAVAQEPSAGIYIKSTYFGSVCNGTSYNPDLTVLDPQCRLTTWGSPNRQNSYFKANNTCFALCTAPTELLPCSECLQDPIVFNQYARWSCSNTTVVKHQCVGGEGCDGLSCEETVYAVVGTTFHNHTSGLEAMCAGHNSSTAIAVPCTFALTNYFINLAPPPVLCIDPRYSSGVICDLCKPDAIPQIPGADSTSHRYWCDTDNVTMPPPPVTTTAAPTPTAAAGAVVGTRLALLLIAAAAIIGVTLG